MTLLLACRSGVVRRWYALARPFFITAANVASKLAALVVLRLWPLHFPSSSYLAHYLVVDGGGVLWQSAVVPVGCCVRRHTVARTAHAARTAPPSAYVTQHCVGSCIAPVPCVAMPRHADVCLSAQPPPPPRRTLRLAGRQRLPGCHRACQCADDGRMRLAAAAIRVAGGFAFAGVPARVSRASRRYVCGRVQGARALLTPHIPSLHQAAAAARACGKGSGAG